MRSCVRVSCTSSLQDRRREPAQRRRSSADRMPACRGRGSRIVMACPPSLDYRAIIRPQPRSISRTGVPSRRSASQAAEERPRRRPCRASRSGCRTSGSGRTTGSRRGTGSRASMLRRVGDPALELLEAALGDADAARVAVVDEDRRAERSAGAGWSRGRRCPSGRTSPRAAASRSARARRRGACRAASASASRSRELLRLGAEPDRLGREARRRAGRAARARSAPARRSSCARSRRPARSPRSRRRRARARAAARSGAAATIVVSRLLLRLRVPVAAEAARRPRAATSSSSSRRGTTRRGAGRRRPACTVE